MGHKLTDEQMIECAKIAFPRHTDFLVMDGVVKCIHQDSTLGAVCDDYDINNPVHFNYLVNNLAKGEAMHLLGSLNENYSSMAYTHKTKEMIGKCLGMVPKNLLACLEGLSFICYKLATPDKNKLLCIESYPHQGSKELYDTLDSIRTHHGNIMFSLQDKGITLRTHAFNNSINAPYVEPEVSL